MVYSRTPIAYAMFSKYVSYFKPHWSNFRAKEQMVDKYLTGLADE